MRSTTAPRQNHGALLDARILADVYLAMTGGQTALFGGTQEQDSMLRDSPTFEPLPAARPRLKVIRATAEELERHERMMRRLSA